MLRDYDKDTSDSDFDGTRGGRPVLYAVEGWAFAPAVEQESGLIAWEIVIHTGSDPEDVTARVSSVRRFVDPSARTAEVRIPSKKVGTATINASVRGVFTFGPGPWATSGTPDTQTTGTVVI